MTDETVGAAAVSSSEFVRLLPIRVENKCGTKVQAWPPYHCEGGQKGKLFVRIEWPKYAETHLLTPDAAMKMVSKHINLAALKQPNDLDQPHERL